MIGNPLNGTGCIVQVATLQEIIIQLVNDIGQKFWCNTKQKQMGRNNHERVIIFNSTKQPKYIWVVLTFID